MDEEPLSLEALLSFGERAWGWLMEPFQVYRIVACVVVLLMGMGLIDQAIVNFSLRAENKLLESQRRELRLQKLEWEIMWYEQNIVIQDLVNELNLTLIMKEEYRKQIEDSTFEGITGTTYRLNPTECDGDPYQPAWAKFKYTDEKVRTLSYVAVSRDLLMRWGGPFEYGDYIRVVGPYPFGGVKQIVDTMAPRWKRRIDLCIPTEVEQGKVRGLVLMDIQPPS